MEEGWERMTKLPDLLTVSRGGVALAFVGLAFAGPGVLWIVVLLMMAGWTTDILDGRLARRYRTEPSWIGRHEFSFDMAMVFASLFYLVGARFIPVLPAAIYVVVAALCIITFRSKSVTMAFAFPVVALPLVVAYFNEPFAAWIYVIWIGLALLTDWRRFKGVVLEFIANAKLLLQRR
jgi:phosphatidylglycerophosphate synthase